jgi:hypothetical protein
MSTPKFRPYRKRRPIKNPYVGQEVLVDGYIDRIDGGGEGATITLLLANGVITIEKMVAFQTLEIRDFKGNLYRTGFKGGPVPKDG